MRPSLIPALLCLLPSLLRGQETRPLRFQIGLGATMGGDVLVTSDYADGTTKRVRAGGVLVVKGGLDWRILPALSFQGSYGFHGDSNTAENGKVEFRRNFFEGLGYWHLNERHRIGLGLRRTFHTKLHGSGAAANIGTVDFDSSLGRIVEYEWLPRFGGSSLGITFRYLNQTFTPTKYNAQPIHAPDVDGSHGGVGITWYF